TAIRGSCRRRNRRPRHDLHGRPPAMPADLSPEVIDLLALNLVPSLGPRLTAALLKHFGSASAVRRATASQLRQVHLVGPTLSEKFAAALNSAPLDREIELIGRHNVRLVALG